MVKSQTRQRRWAGLVRLEDAARYRIFSSTPLFLYASPSQQAVAVSQSHSLFLCSPCTFEFVFPSAYFAVLFVRLQLQSSLSLCDSAFISFCSLTHTRVDGENAIFIGVHHYAGWLRGLQKWRFNTAWIIKPPGPVTDTETYTRRDTNTETHSCMASKTPVHLSCHHITVCVCVNLSFTLALH